MLPGDPHVLHPAYNRAVTTAIEGRMVSPRGLTTFEGIGPMMLKTKANLTVARKGMNTKLAIVEALMMISGEFYLDAIIAAAPKSDITLWEKQSDYGTRIRDQMPEVLQLLRDDRWTRRAVAYFNHGKHFQSDDLACSTALHFMIRNDTLETTMNVRSWDLAFGLPMDIMTHGIVAQVMALAANVQTGDLYATANSAHVYATTMHLASAERDLEFNLGPCWPAAGNEWHAYRMRAKHAIQEFRTYGALNPGLVRTEKVN
jgi:hypothetical protein